jgi:hypothetical protein
MSDEGSWPKAMIFDNLERKVQTPEGLVEICYEFTGVSTRIVSNILEPLIKQRDMLLEENVKLLNEIKMLKDGLFDIAHDMRID